MKVAVASDHRGISAVDQIEAILAQLGHEYVEFLARDEQPVDYPDTAYLACKTVAEGTADRAILVCGTGIGMSIAANKVKGIRAALCYDELTARMCRQHNDANVVCMSGDLLGSSMLRKIVETFLATEFVQGRHARRVNKIKAIEDGLDPRDVNNQ